MLRAGIVGHGLGQPLLAVRGVLSPVEQAGVGQGGRAGADARHRLAVREGLAQQRGHGLVLALGPGVAADRDEEVGVAQHRIVKAVVGRGQDPADRGLGLTVRRGDLDLDLQFAAQQGQHRPGLPIGPARLQKCDGDGHGIS